MKENVLQTIGGSLHYWISEPWDLDKPTIFFFHGLTADHTMFEQQYNYFAEEYNIIAWDAPGHGKSRPFNGFSMDIAVEIVHLILTQFRIHHFIAVGQSFGGYIPQAVMCRYPNVIDALIGIGTSPYGNGYYTKSDFFWLRQVGWMSMCYPWNALKNASSKGATVTTAGYENMMQMLDYILKMSMLGC